MSTGTLLNRNRSDSGCLDTRAVFYVFCVLLQDDDHPATAHKMVLAYFEVDGSSVPDAASET